jgi:hypothetical protein
VAKTVLAVTPLVKQIFCMNQNLFRKMFDKTDFHV